MKLEAEHADGQTIHSYGLGWVQIIGEKIEHSLLLMPQGVLQDWQCSQFSDLTAAHFEQLANFDAELVIFGSGERIQFPPVAWLAPLIHKRIGLETMDSGAACRTYNILASEGRNVLLALLIENKKPKNQSNGANLS